MASSLGLAADIQLSGAAGKPGPFPVSSLMHSRRRIIIASLALLWLAAMLAAWFQARYIRPFDERTELRSSAASCACRRSWPPGRSACALLTRPFANVGNQQHPRRAGRAVRAAACSSTRYRRPAARAACRQSAAAAARRRCPAAEGLAASPAVAIWDQQGQPAYFGPWQRGCPCAPPATASSSRSLEALETGAGGADTATWRWVASATGRSIDPWQGGDGILHIITVQYLKLYRFSLRSGSLPPVSS